MIQEVEEVDYTYTALRVVWNPASIHNNNIRYLITANPIE